jgi:CheY-like chemotaxis protein
MEEVAFQKYSSYNLPCKYRFRTTDVTGLPIENRHSARRCVMPAKNRILVVDDEEALRVVLSAELEGEGYQVTSAADGQDAINILTTKGFDLILLDIKMPNVDGFEVLKFIKDRWPKTKVVMLTGFADLKNAIESKKLGAEDFVSKPYDLVDLLTTVERVLTTA